MDELDKSSSEVQDDKNSEVVNAEPISAEDEASEGPSQISKKRTRKKKSHGSKDEGYGQQQHDPGLRASGVQSRQESMWSTASDLEQELTISWHDLNVYAPGDSAKQSLIGKALNVIRKKEPQQPPKHILKGISGRIQPGRLMAIMGASGAGKTTLLNVLAQQNVKNIVVDGKICINGQELGVGIRTVSAYIQQQDLFIGTLKVKEHLMFQATLRMGKTYSYHQRRARVEEVLQQLGLKKCEDHLIGTPHKRGISGGERKRVAFASEILTNPLILFADEPTSGLDSYMAEQVVDVLKQMTLKGRTVVCTIHQPSSQVFGYFEDLLLMSEGKVAYLGPTKKASEFFESLRYPCPQNFNPADHFVKTLAIVPGREDECLRRSREVCDACTKMELQRTLFDASTLAVGHHQSLRLAESTCDSSRYRSTWRQQVKVLVTRSVVSSTREPLLYRVRLLQTLLLAFVIGITNFQIGMDCLSVQTINGLIFLIVGHNTGPYMFPAAIVFCEELPVFLREHFNNLYRVDVYFFAKTLVETPQCTMFPVIFLSIIYTMSGLRHEFTAYLTALFIIIIVANTSASFGYLISVIFGNLGMFFAVAPYLIVIFVIFGGFLINQMSIPPYFLFIEHLNFVKYAYEALLINEWAGVGHIDVGSKSTNETCWKNGDQVLGIFDFHTKNFFPNIAVLLVIAVVTRLLAYFALIWRARKGT